MIFSGKPPIGVFDLLVTGLLRNAKNCIVVFAVSQEWTIVG
jgi:hypothetical protein